MSIVASRGTDQFPLRFPDGMRDEIKAAAEASGRSMNSEILARLSATGIGGGKTLRDEFATAALAAMLTNGFMPTQFAEQAQHGDCHNPWDFAAAAYAAADAMLAARQKGGA